MLTTPDYASADPLLMHLALPCDDIDSTITRLPEADASLVREATLTSAGDRLAMLRDPWSLAVQLCQRKVPMV